MPPAYILRQYRDLGGDLITIGTDAHEPQHMASGLEQGMELLRQTGFRYITLYKHRNPQQILL
jgi:histidinol-phosphatase (PHP family)